MNTPHDPARAAALQHLHTFCTNILPGTVRRIAVWKQLRRAHVPDLVAELHQELAVDCLEHAALLVAMSTNDRNARWMRFSERWIYHQLVRGRTNEEVHENVPAPALGRFVPPALLAQGVHLGNGRWNMTATARRSGRRAAELQRELDRLLVHLGHDDEYDEFWRMRLAEAFTGLAADLLRERGCLHTLAREHRAPDVRARLRRIRSIGARFEIRPSTLRVRRILRPWLRRPRLDEGAPRRLLEGAVALAPGKSAPRLWLFEACIDQGDVRGAAATIRAACRCRPLDRPTLVLARARLLEARGRFGAAHDLVARAARRWPTEPRLRRALAAVSDRRSTP